MKFIPSSLRFWDSKESDQATKDALNAEPEMVQPEIEADQQKRLRKEQILRDQQKSENALTSMASTILSQPSTTRDALVAQLMTLQNIKELAQDINSKECALLRKQAVDAVEACVRDNSEAAEAIARNRSAILTEIGATAHLFNQTIRNAAPGKIQDNPGFSQVSRTLAMSIGFDTLSKEDNTAYHDAREKAHEEQVRKTVRLK